MLCHFTQGPYTSIGLETSRIGAASGINFPWILREQCVSLEYRLSLIPLPKIPNIYNEVKRIKSKGHGHGKIAQLLNERTALVEDLSSSPSAHLRWLKTICNSNSRESDTFFHPLW